MRSVFITGGASGIGAATTRRAAQQGWTVFIGYHTGQARASALEQEIKKAGGTAHAVPFTLEEPNAAANAMGLVEKTGVGLDALVLAAALPPTLNGFARLGANDFSQHWTTTVLGNYELMTQAWNVFFRVKKKGRIIGLLSTALGPPVWPNMSSYIVAKRGLQALMECAAAEFGPKGLQVSFVSPDYTATPMLLNQERLIVEMAQAKQKNHRFLEPDEVAKVIVDCLNSDTTDVITSHAISG